MQLSSNNQLTNGLSKGNDGDDSTPDMYKGVVDFGKTDSSRITDRNSDSTVVQDNSISNSKISRSSKKITKTSGFIFETRRSKTFVVPEESKEPVSRKSIKKQKETSQFALAPATANTSDLVCSEEFENFGDEDEPYATESYLSPNDKQILRPITNKYDNLSNQVSNEALGIQLWNNQKLVARTNETSTKSS